MIIEDEDYPIEKLIPSIKKITKPVDQQTKESILNRLNSSSHNMEKALAIHDMFRQLSGNPMSIRILASFHANVLIKNNDLKSIYLKVKSERTFMDEDKAKSNGTSQANNMVSLRLSTETSVQLLRDTSP